jgi:hypothetical protein
VDRGQAQVHQRRGRGGGQEGIDEIEQGIPAPAEGGVQRPPEPCQTVQRLRAILRDDANHDGMVPPHGLLAPLTVSPLPHEATDRCIKD